MDLRRFSPLPTVLTLLSVCFLPLPAMAEPALSPPNVLIVTGEGSQTVPTTLTEAQLTVEVRGSSATEVQRAIAERSNRLVAYLQGQQVTKLQTQGLQLQPNYVYRDNERRMEGYIGTNTISFEHPTPAIGALLDGSVNAGATRIDGIRFIASGDAIKAARVKALQAATADAQAQAQTVLATLNLSPKAVSQIVINPDPGISPRPMPLMMRSAMADSAPPTPVISGDQTVTARVMLEIRY